MYRKFIKKVIVDNICLKFALLQCVYCKLPFFLSYYETQIFPRPGLSFLGCMTEMTRKVGGHWSRSALMDLLISETFGLNPNSFLENQFIGVFLM